MNGHMYGGMNGLVDRQTSGQMDNRCDNDGGRRGREGREGREGRRVKLIVPVCKSTFLHGHQSVKYVCLSHSVGEVQDKSTAISRGVQEVCLCPCRRL